MKVIKKNEFYGFIAASLAMLVPVPGRFSCGIVLVLGVNLFMIAGTLFRSLIKKLNLEELQPVLMAILLVSVAVLYKLLLTLFSPLLGLVLGFDIYLSAISSFLIGCLYEKSTEPLNVEFSRNLKKSGQFSLFALAFFLFRDIFGYGTVTLPSTNGMLSAVLFRNESYFSPSVFWASIPGALVLTALLIVLFTHIAHSFELLEDTENKSIAVEEKKQEATAVQEMPAAQEMPAEQEMPAAQKMPAEQEMPAAQKMPGEQEMPAEQEIPVAQKMTAPEHDEPQTEAKK